MTGYIVRVYEEIRTADLDQQFIVAEGRADSDSPSGALATVAKEGLDENHAGIDAAFEMQSAHDDWERAGVEIDPEEMQNLALGIHIGMDVGRRSLADPHVLGLILARLPHYRDMTEDEKTIAEWIAETMRAFAPRAALAEEEGGEDDVGNDD